MGIGRRLRGLGQGRVGRVRLLLAVHQGLHGGWLRSFFVRQSCTNICVHFCICMFVYLCICIFAYLHIRVFLYLCCCVFVYFYLFLDRLSRWVSANISVGLYHTKNLCVIVFLVFLYLFIFVFVYLCICISSWEGLHGGWLRSFLPGYLAQR